MSQEVQTTAESAEQVEVLNVKQGKRLLRQLETNIAKGIRDFWTVGESLWTIREQGLYKERYSGEAYESFGDYIQARWGYSRAYQLISAARVRRLMMELGIKAPDCVCQSERQYREHLELLKLPQDKLETLKASIAGKKKLSSESFGVELRKLLPEPSPKQPKPITEEKMLCRRLAKLEKEIAGLRNEYPSLVVRIDAWIQELLKV